MANVRTTRLGPGHYRHEPLVGPGFEVFLTPDEAATPNGRRSYWTWQSEVGTATGYATKAAAIDAAIAALKAAGPAKIEEPVATPAPAEAPKPSVLHSIPLDQLCALAEAGLLPAGAYIDEAIRREAAPVRGTRFRHRKTGGAYEVIGRAKMQADTWVEHNLDPLTDLTSIDMREVVVYRSVEHRTLWARPVEEFKERFDAIETDLYATMAENIFGAPAAEKAEPAPVYCQYLSKADGTWVVATSPGDPEAQAAWLTSKGYQTRLLYAGEINYPKLAGHHV